ncbi:MAG TPA: hypothetical protein VMZ03_13020 [Chitinophagaceae bacterium]|nr:hypothetical protein [Chitinophagaceae bacterium]
MSKSTKKKKTVKALRDKHLADKNHVITDQEIKELDLDIDTTDPVVATHVPELPDNENRPKDEDKDPEMVTPWDIIK